MNGMYSLRHNAESGEMYKSIAKGRLGASTIVQDMTSADTMQPKQQRRKPGYKPGSGQYYERLANSRMTNAVVWTDAGPTYLYT